MSVLDIAISCGVAPKRVSSVKGGEYASACPMCGGNDRFRVWPIQGEHGAWWCRGCGKGGDALQLLREAKGMSFKEACDYLGKQAPRRTMTRGKTPREPKAQGPDFIPREITDPTELWRSRAEAFTEWAHKVLIKHTAQLAWLAGRGITIATVERFRLGWNPEDLWREKSAWGVEDNGKKLWLPEGLVIPWTVDGRIHRLRIRRPAPDAEPRYYVVPGSGMAPMMIRPDSLSGRGRAAWLIVESELDAILVSQDAGEIIGAASLGNSTAKPDGELYEALKGAACILNALDNDAAGAKAWKWWQTHFVQAERWPVPQGKDPGDYRKGGGDIRAWVLAGLPLGLRPAPAVERSEETKQPEVNTQKGDHIADAGKMVENEKPQIQELTPNVPPDKKAGLPAGDLIDTDLAPYVVSVVNFPCGHKVTTYMPIGQRYTAPCFKCLPEQKKTERKVKTWM